MNDLMENLDKLRTTELGMARIRRNTGADAEDIVEWCKDNIERSDETVRRGKNWYVRVDGIVMTINARSFTIITAHEDKQGHLFGNNNKNKE